MTKSFFVNFLLTSEFSWVYLSASFPLTGNDVIFTVRRQMFGIDGTPRKCLRPRASAQFGGSTDTWHWRRIPPGKWEPRIDGSVHVCVRACTWTQTLSGNKRQTETCVRLPGSPEVRPPVISFSSNAALLFLTHAVKLSHSESVRVCF